MLTDKINFLNLCCNLFLFVFYVFRTSYVHFHEDYIVLYCIILYYIVLYFNILYYIVLYCTIVYYIVLHFTRLYYIVLYCTTLYYIVIYCTIVYYIVLYYRNINNLTFYTLIVIQSFNILWLLMVLESLLGRYLQVWLKGVFSVWVYSLPCVPMWSVRHNDDDDVYDYN